MTIGAWMVMLGFAVMIRTGWRMSEKQRPMKRPRKTEIERIW